MRLTSLFTIVCACACGAPGIPLDDARKERALQLISVFEHNTPELQFADVDDREDGRGYTCGLGLTTARGDVLAAVEQYTEQQSTNPLATYLPTLRDLAAAKSGDISELDGFTEAWAGAATDDTFIDVQRAVVDAHSYAQALAHAQQLEFTSALSLFMLWDAVWMHGDGADGDGVPALIERASERGGTTRESGFLSAFLDVRAENFDEPENELVENQWERELPRLDVQRELLEDENLDFNGPIEVGHDFDETVP